MPKKLINFTPRQIAALTDEADKLQISFTELVRRITDLHTSIRFDANGNMSIVGRVISQSGTLPGYRPEKMRQPRARANRKGGRPPKTAA